MNMNKVLVPFKGNSSMIGVMTKTGSRNELEKVKGISHFIEHLCFKGTANRTGKQINTSIENIGGDLNAFTDTEITCYWARVANTHLLNITDVITDLVVNPVFPVKEIDKEREVIIQELKMYQDNPKDYLYELFNNTYFKKESSLHTSVIGTIDSLYRTKRKDILEYYKRRYEDLTLIIVGDINSQRKESVSEIEKKISKELAYSTGIKEKFEYRKGLSQANLMIGGYHQSVRDITQDDFALTMLDNLYNGMAGRLFARIREKHNLCYRIKFNSDTMRDGLIVWSVNVGLESNKIDFARKMIVKELTRPFTKKEIDIAVDKAIGQESLRLDNIQHVFNLIAFAELKKTNYSSYIYEYATNIKKASEHINDFRETMQFNKNLAVGVLPA